MRVSYKKRIESLKSCVEVQGTDGNWNFDEYMRGMYNGLELALSIMENRNPIYKDSLKDIRGRTFKS